MKKAQNVRRRILETFTYGPGERREVLSCGHHIAVEEYHRTATVICPDCTENRAPRLKGEGHE